MAVLRSISTKDDSVPQYIDTHTHLDAEQFADDLEEVVGEAICGGVGHFINIGYEPARWTSTARLAATFSQIHPVFGMHPGSADQWNDETAARLESLARDERPLAIGEIGIDLFRGETNLGMQRAAFSDQLDLAERFGLPIVIHMRAAEVEVLHLLSARATIPPLLFHSFEGSSALTAYVNETGSFVGVGGLATRAKSVAIRQELQRIDISRMVLETDSPYLIPARRRGSRNVPSNLPAIASMLADLTVRQIADVAAITTRNAIEFFGMGRGILE